MLIPFVDLVALHAPLQPTILQAMDQLLQGGVVMGGQPLATFEASFAQYIGTGHCVACANGTDALEIILRALAIQPGDEVVVPANGWMSAAEAVRLVGATPVFVDNDPTTYAMRVDNIAAHLTARTRAIIPVHLYGLVTDLSPVMELARQRNITVIEDCAQAHGAMIGDRRAGSWGDAAAFSFYPTKNLGALGDGGAMVTHDEKLAAAMRRIANHGQVARDQPVQLGRNSRMDTWQAIVLAIKLPYLNEWNGRRRQLARRYEQQLSGAPLTLPVIPEDEQQHVHHLYVVRVANRRRVQQYLAEHGVITQIHYPTPVPYLAPFEMLSSAQEKFPTAAQQASELLSLPLHPTMSLEAVDYVSDILWQAIADGSVA